MTAIDEVFFSSGFQSALVESCNNVTELKLVWGPTCRDLKWFLGCRIPKPKLERLELRLGGLELPSELMLRSTPRSITNTTT